MKRSPSALSSRAPSPRSASDSRKRGVPGTVITVGWNWTNSRSLTAAPARQPRATPSPVAIGGLVVSRKMRPAPPVARSVADARTSAARRVVHVARTDADAVARRRDRWRGRRARSRTPAQAAARSHSTRPISRPVASRAWSTRLTLCAPSRPSENAPSAPRSNAAPQSASSATRAGPSSTSTRTASGRHRPSPAAIVSAPCSAGESSRPTAAAMPPWAYPVLLSSGRSALVSTSTDPAAASETAARRPATPLPMTRKSAAVTRVYPTIRVPTVWSAPLHVPHLDSRCRTRRRLRGPGRAWRTHPARGRAGPGRAAWTPRPRDLAASVGGAGPARAQRRARHHAPGRGRRRTRQDAAHRGPRLRWPDRRRCGSGRHRRRAGRRCPRRSGGLRRRHLPARRAAGTGADHAHGPGRQRHRRQGRRQPPAREEPDRRLPPAAGRAGRSRGAGHAAAARVPGRPLRGDQIRRDRRCGVARPARRRARRGAHAARRRAGRAGHHLLPDQGGRGVERRA